MIYPDARRAPTVDTYHGTPVADPYRWLEDADAPDTLAWVEAENALTRSVLDGPERDAIRKRLASSTTTRACPCRSARARATSTRATRAC